ncbi:MAG TPA: iron ABC transporter permease [Dehalococcoidia bacterium]|nr:iron ABC transporter permease [Dehalococcoidia bacterium]
MAAGRLLFLVPLGYLAVFLLYPLGSILARSLGGEAGYGFEPFKVLLSDSYYLGRIWFTVWQAVVSTLLTLAVGLPAAFLFTKYEFPGKTLLKAVSTLPFVMPTIVVAMGFTALFGTQGIVNTALMSSFGLDEPPVRITNSLTIIFMAHAFYNYAIIVRIVSALWSNLDPSMEHSARVLGAGPVRTFYHVTLPLLLPAIISASLLAFVFSFTSFGVVLVLGGPQFATLEVTIYELTAKLFRLPLAGALAVIQLAFTYLFLLLYSRFQEQSVVRVDLKPREVISHRAVRWRDKVFVIGMVMVLLTMLAPLIALVVRWITFDGGFATTQMANLFSDERGSYFHLSPLTIIWNSLRFALITVAISLVIGLIVSYLITNLKRRWRSVADALVMLPLGVSAVTLGFGYIIALGRPPLDLRGSWVILVIAHSLVAYPFVIRSLLPVLKGMNPNLREAAAVLGATPSRVFLLVELPMIAPALLVGATFAFAVSMGEFGASLILVRTEFTTMPVAIFRYLGLPGAANLSMALGMSCLLMAVVAVGFIAIERFRYKGVGGF